MFFEASEKKLEIVIKEQNLLDLSDIFYKDLVRLCGALVLNKIQNKQQKAYVLSESSLFVWQNKILLITCGQTNLIKCLLFLLNYFGNKNIKNLIYQRKNEFFSKKQPSFFLDDFKKIQKNISGESYLLGDLSSHYSCIFSSIDLYKSKKEDTTIEFLMYKISEKSRLFLQNANKNQIFQYLFAYLDLTNFLIDDYKFSPYGYSINAIYKEKYFTLHLSPEDLNSYVSFETNLDLIQAKIFINNFLKKLEPASFDLIGFNLDLKKSFANYVCFDRNYINLKAGYLVDYSCFYKEASQKIKAKELILE